MKWLLAWAYVSMFCLILFVVLFTLENYYAFKQIQFLPDWMGIPISILAWIGILGVIPAGFGISENIGSKEGESTVFYHGIFY